MCTAHPQSARDAPAAAVASAAVAMTRASCFAVAAVTAAATRCISALAVAATPAAMDALAFAAATDLAVFRWRSTRARANASST
jgi:hypothetical protein